MATTHFYHEFAFSTRFWVKNFTSLGTFGIWDWEADVWVPSLGCTQHCLWEAMLCVCSWISLWWNENDIVSCIEKVQLSRRTADWKVENISRNFQSQCNLTYKIVNIFLAAYRTHRCVQHCTISFGNLVLKENIYYSEVPQNETSFKLFIGSTHLCD